LVEWRKCKRSVAYFIDTYCQVYDAEALGWIPFKLWPAQFKVLRFLQQFQLLIALKARQLGMTWLMLGYALWLMIFYPIATILIFSKRDDEAVYLLGPERLRGMYYRLPEWMQAQSVTTDDRHIFGLSNGSIARAFPTSAGDSYTATFALADEFDLVEDQGGLLNRVQPTIDAGGKLAVISRVDKRTPNSRFKQIYRAAKAGLNSWKAVFLPWNAHPGRMLEWYEQKKRDTLAATGALDDLYEQYPATDVEALAGKTLNKRISAEWLMRCYIEMASLEPKAAPAIPGLLLYRLPEPGVKYVGGVDPAEGNPTSDESSFTFIDRVTQEEVAHLSGKFQPEVLAAHADTVGKYFNNAPLLVERNNHGHAVILWLREHSPLTLLRGHDKKIGWHTTDLSKVLLYDHAAPTFRDGDTIIHTFLVQQQLASIEGSTLSAPPGEMDDRAVSYVLSLMANKQAGGEWEGAIA
jgi:hypothetical protein